MNPISEGSLKFTFPADWKAEKYEGWIFYRNQFQSVCGGAKAVDILAMDTNQCLWLIEIKDYRQHSRTKVIKLADEVAMKVRDTLAGLAAAQCNANDENEKTFARCALGVHRLKVVLHIEQPAKHSKLFPRVFDPADITQKMKQLIKAISPHPLVTEKGKMRNVAWTVQ